MSTGRRVPAVLAATAALCTGASWAMPDRAARADAGPAAAPQAVGQVAAAPRLRLAVSPATGHRHDRFTVAITSRHATGDFGRTRRSYFAQARAVRPASACVNDRDAVFPSRPAGTRMRVRLDPARGKGGKLGWCRGRFRGRVIYTAGYACPDDGPCDPPRGFPHERRVVGRFTFRVR